MNKNQQALMQFLKDEGLTTDQAMANLTNLKVFMERCKIQEEKLIKLRHAQDSFDSQAEKIKVLKDQIEAHHQEHANQTLKMSKMMPIRQVSRLKGKLDALISLTQNIAMDADCFDPEEAYP